MQCNGFFHTIFCFETIQFDYKLLLVTKTAQKTTTTTINNTLPPHITLRPYTYIYVSIRLGQIFFGDTCKVFYRQI